MITCCVKAKGTIGFDTAEKHNWEILTLQIECIVTLLFELIFKSTSNNNVIMVQL